MDDKFYAVLQKIEKLLSITEENGATEDEAIAAALMAQRLIAKYKIRKGDFANKADEVPIVSVPGIWEHGWHTSLAWAIAKNFRCTHYREAMRDSCTKKRYWIMQFYGYRPDAEAAKLVYMRLVKVATRQGNAYARKRAKELELQHGQKISRAAVFNTWVESFIGGVRSELERQSNELALVFPQEVRESYEKFSKGFVFRRKRQVKKVRDWATREDGRSAGRDSIRAGRMGAMNPNGQLPD